MGVSSSIRLDDACFTHRFKLNYLETENAAIGQSVVSEDISAGGHLWRIICYPRGNKEDDNGEYLSIFLRHKTKSKGAEAVFEAFILDRYGPYGTAGAAAAPSLSRHRVVKVFAPKGSTKSKWGWDRFVKRSLLKPFFERNNGSFTIVAEVKVVHDDPDPLDVPSSNIGSHLGLLLDSTDGSDVSFVVDGEKFPAHRAVLAARSPVFKAQLLGSMADAKMPSITLHDISPETFKIMLRFIYTDACPEESELGDSPSEMLQDLLAAADRFALDRLKLFCASKLWDKISVDTVATALMCAETYNCPRLKKKCIDFFGEGKNFKTKALFTEGFAQLVLNFPLIVDELKEKIGA